MDILPLELRKLGLTEKEVKVYLAGLELGPSSVQNIAKSAKVTRPTAYETIKKLEEKGLFKETKDKGKKALIAQSPERILGILRIQKKEIEEREREFIRIIATLESKYSKEKGVKTFKGKEGIRALEETLSFSSTPDIFIINPKQLRIKKDIFKHIKKRLGKLNIKEFNHPKLKGSLIVFDKIIFFPLPNDSEGGRRKNTFSAPGKQKAFLIS